MKRIFLMMFMVVSVFTVNAQTAIETSKLFDNVTVGVETGVSTPLTLDNLFPLNPSVGIHVGKYLTPVTGLEVEGTAWLGSHVAGDGRFDGLTHSAFRGSYVGANMLTNWSNLVSGYAGKPRNFEVSTVLGLGWIHTYTPNMSDRDNNYLGAKTGLDLAFNLGNDKAHTLSVRPAVLWNLSTPGNSIEALAFNKKGAQLYLGVGYTYHFKNSNGTRYFKTHDVGAYLTQIAELQQELTKKPKEVYIEKIVTKDVPSTRGVQFVGNGTYVIYFAQNSSTITEEQEVTLNKIKGGKVIVKGYASPEGTSEYNKQLSKRRADNVAEYLKSKGVEVTEVVGNGVNGNTSNRVVEVIVEQPTRARRMPENRLSEKN